MVQQPFSSVGQHLELSARELFSVVHARSQQPDVHIICSPPSTKAVTGNDIASKRGHLLDGTLRRPCVFYMC